MSRYPNIGNAVSPTTRHHSTYFTTTTSIPRSPLSSSSRSRHEQQEHQLTSSSYQPPRVSTPTMTTLPTLPTLPPISTLPYDNLFSPQYKNPSNDHYNRYSSSVGPLSINTPQSTPTTPYSATSSTSSFSSYLPSPLPQPLTPTQNPSPSQPSNSQPSYYQQRSPHYSQSTFSSYSQYSQTPSSPAQPSPRRTTQQLQHYSSQQQQSPIYGSPHHPHSQSSSTQQSTHTPIRPYQRSHTSQNVISEPFVTVTPELNNRPPRRRRRPPFSYSSLIAQAILDSPDRRLTLREVYQWIMERYPQLYKADDTGWQNTIRHNLSLNKCFKKVPRSDTELGHSTPSSAASKGKGGYWTIDPEYMSAYHDGVFARGGVQKRRPGEVGLHPGMGPGLGDDDSGSSDTSPSDNMAGRLVDVEDDGYHHHSHHHHHNIHQQQHYHHHVHHNGMAGSTGDRLPLTLTVPPPVAVPSSTSLMTPPLSSGGVIQTKSKRLYVSKRHSSETNFTNLASPSAYVPASGPNSGRYDVFHLAELTDPSSPLDHSNSNRDISPYSIGSRGSNGQSSEWDKIKMDIDQGDSCNSFYYGNHSMSPEGNDSRNVIQQTIGEIDSSHSSSSMKIRDLLN